MSSPIPLLKRAQAAHIRELSREKQARQADGTFIVEGAKAIADLLACRSDLIVSIVTTASYREREFPHHRRLRAAISSPSYSCPEHTFATLSDLDSPPGVLAIVKQPVWKEEDVWSQPTILGIYGERIQDPLNVGAIIRTAAALNVSALWLTVDSADRYNPKVVRAASGALFSLPVFLVPELSNLLRRGCSVYAAEVEGPSAVHMETINRVPPRLVLALGNEGSGLSTKTKKLATRRFTIPLSRHIESLNVAATMAIATHYFGRLQKKHLD